MEKTFDLFYYIGKRPVAVASYAHLADKCMNPYPYSPDTNTTAQASS
jgi:hypothetical protein